METTTIQKDLKEEIAPQYLEMIEHPKHYSSHPSGIECIEIVKHYNFCLGNVIKYIWRAGLKNADEDLQDLEKALFYLKFEIEERRSKVK